MRKIHDISAGDAPFCCRSHITREFASDAGASDVSNRKDFTPLAESYFYVIPI